MIISLDKYKKTGQLKPEEELYIELTENGVFEYLPSEGSVYSKAIVTVNVTSVEPGPSGTIEDGEYLIVSSDNYLLSSEANGMRLNAVKGSTFVHPDTSAEFDPVNNPDTSIITDAKLRWTICKDGDMYYIYNIVNGEKMYLAWDSGNYAHIQESPYGLYIDTIINTETTYRISIIDDASGRFLQRNSSSNYFAFYSSLQKGSVYLIKTSGEVIKPEEPEDDKPEISFIGLTLYPGVEYMMVGETYDMTFETDYEPGTYEIFTQQFGVEVDYDNKVLRITPTGNGLTEFCMYNYNLDIYEGERYLEVQVPAKYKATINLDSLQFPSETIAVPYEISEELVEDYWFEIDNCDIETNREEKCIYVTPQYGGVLVDSNNVKLCWYSNVGTCYAEVNTLPPFTIPEDFPAVQDISASSWVDGDTVIVEVSCYPLGEGRPMHNIEIFNNGHLVYKPLNFDGWLSASIPTSDLTVDGFEILATADYKDNCYDLIGIWVPIDGWENRLPENYIPEFDTDIWGNPDDAQVISWSDFESVEPLSINSDTGEVSNAQWYELTGTLLSAPQSETGRWIFGDPDNIFSQNVTRDDGMFSEHCMLINYLENPELFPGDGATIKIRTLKHVATVDEAGLDCIQNEGEVIFGGEYKGSPKAIYMGEVSIEPEPL